MAQTSKTRGWLLIFAIAVALAAFVILGTLDASQRYDLIGI